MKKLLLLIVILFFSCEKEQINTYVPETVEYSDYQKEVLDELNYLRSENNIQILKPEKLLSVGAKQHAIYMNVLDTLNHDYFWIRYTNSKSKYFGEVVAGYYLTPYAEISAFENSPRHYSTIMNPVYKYVGIYKEGNYLCINLAAYE
jgi:uncharacterized protein YkwD